MELWETRIYKKLENRDIFLKTKTDEISVITKKFLSKISTVFPNYTNHGIEHCINIIENISDILGNQLSSLSNTELALILYAALLHDIGMAVDTSEIQRLKSGELLYDDCLF